MAFSMDSVSQCGARPCGSGEQSLGTGHMQGSSAREDSLIVHWPEAVRKLPPVSRVTELSWPPGMLEHIAKEGPSHVSTCQQISLRAVLKLLSAVCIAGPKQGKTIGWVFPVMANLADLGLYSGLPGTLGPRVVVLCSGQTEVSDLGQVISVLVDKAKLGLSVVASTARDKAQMMADIVNGCDVLLVNPTQLCDLCDDLSFILNRCCHLIIESGHKTLDIHEPSIHKIWLHWRKCKLTEKHDQKCPDQVVVVSEAWNQPVMDFVKNFLSTGTHLSPVIMFSSLTEAAVYKKEVFLLSFHKNSIEKINHLRQVINKVSGRSVICFSRSKYFRQAESALLSDGRRVFSVNAEKDLFDQDDIVKDWISSEDSLLLITDKSLKSLLGYIPGSCLNLIHFDLPARSKNSFSSRFTFIRDELSEKRRDIPLCQIRMLISAEDSQAFQSLFSIMARVNPDAKNVLSALRSDQLCRSVTDVDFACVQTCSKRHWLRPDDSDHEKRLTGLLSLRVLRVMSPVEYTVTVLTPDLETTYQHRAFSMARYFCKEENILPVTPSDIAVNYVLAVQSSEGQVYSRARVTGVASDKKTVTVAFLDSGLEDRVVKLASLFQLPASLNEDKFPAEAIKARLVGLRPPHRDPDWSEASTKIMAGHLCPPEKLRDMDREEVTRGRVFLNIQGALLLDRLQLTVRHSALGTWVTHLDTRQWLLDSGWGVAAPDKIQRLRWLAQRAGLVTPDQDLTKDSVENIDCDVRENASNPKLAQSYLSLRDYAIVNVTEVISPTEFYVQVVSHQRSYASLQQELDRLGVTIEEQASDYSPRVGDMVMAGVRTGKETDYHRAVVTNVNAEEVTVFLSDWGRTRVLDQSMVSLCPPDLVTRLPAQAVKCALAGITVVKEKVTQAGDLLFDLVTNCTEEDENFLDLVCVAESANGGVYTVRLYNTLSHDSDHDLGSILVKFGLVKQLECSKKETSDLESLSENITDNCWTFDKDIILQKVEEKISSETEVDEESAIINSLRNNNIRGGESAEMQPLITPSAQSEDTSTNQKSERFCQLSWRQTLRSLTVFLDFDTFLTLNNDQVQVSVTENALQVSVSEDTPRHTVHKLPCQRLDFFASVKESSVRIEINHRRVTIHLEKAEGQMWERLGLKKWAWIRRNEVLVEEECQEDGASFAREREEGMRPLPEAAWEDQETKSEDSWSSSEFDQSLSEEGEADFVNEDEESHSE